MFQRWLVLVAFLVPSLASAQDVTTPKQYFGFNLGDDYCLANYKQTAGYWKKLESESERVKVVKIGVTEEGRDQLMAIVTSPANHKKLDDYRSIARKLAIAAGVDAAEARKLAGIGKAVVWIDGGLHASETLCAQMLTETIYQYAAAQDAESLRILDDVIILCVHANPDGNDLVADWYMRDKDPKKRTLTGVPRLYQKYTGHDNNRDFYANTQAETKNMNRVLYREWFPHIVYNHHQQGPPGTVLFIPPFRGPHNYNIDPLVMNGIDAVGAAMLQRFLVEGKPGATCRSGANYSTWYNGGLRTTTYYHNMLGLLSETIGSPTPMQIPFRPALQLPQADYLAPIEPQVWRFRQSVDYSVTANKAVLDYASRNREHLLHNIWLMGKNAIARGSKDSWTITPKMVAAAEADETRSKTGAGAARDFARLFRDPARRDPRGYIIPVAQHDFLTATKFVNALLGTGVQVHRAKADFTIAGKKYGKGSYIVRCDQAFRAHVLDMFEPQDHPNDFAYPGAPPTPPYDAAGWTLAYQMGVKFDRVLDGFEGPFEELPDVVSPPAGKIFDEEEAVGYFLHTRANDSFRAVNRLLKAGEEVRRLQAPFDVNGAVHPAGMFFIPKKATTQLQVKKIADEIGVRFGGTPVAPGKEAVTLKPARIGLWDRYGGSMPSGWTRWILEQFEYPHQVLFTGDFGKTNLSEHFDVLLFVDGAIPYQGKPTDTGMAPTLRKFMEAGGTVITIGVSTDLARQVGLELGNHLTVKDVPLGRDKYYVPSSVLRVRVDPKHPLAWGMPDEVDVVFANSPTFRIPEGMTRVAWFDSKTPLRSGWAWGQEHLEGGVAVAEARVGKGRLVLCGPQVLFRAQPHGTFKFVFNAVVQGSVRDR